MVEQDRFEDWMLARIAGLNAAMGKELGQRRYSAVSSLDLRVRTLAEALSEYRMLRSWEKDDGGQEP